MFKNNNRLHVEAYTDADWARSVTDRRSTSGYYSFVRGIWSLGEVRNNQLLQGVVQRLNLEQHPMEYVSYSCLGSYSET